VKKDTLNIGLVGYKFMGKAHSNAFRKVGMFFEPSVNIGMKAICGRDEAWVKEAVDLSIENRQWVEVDSL